MNIKFYLINSARTYQAKGKDAYHKKLESEGKPIPPDDKNRKIQTEALIYMSVYYDRERFVVSTREKINPEEWDARFQRAKDDDDLNEHLDAMRKWAKNIWRKAHTERYKTDGFVDVEFRKADFRNHFKGELSRIHSGDRNSLYQTYQDYIEHKRREGMKKDSIGNLETFIGSMEKKWPKLGFSDITKHFEKDFLKHYITDLELSHGYIQNYRGHLTAFMRWSVEEGHTKNMEFDRWNLKIETLDVDDNVYKLSAEEVNRIWTLDGLDPKAEIVRDAFVFNCEFGLRIGDLSTLKKSRIIQVGNGYMFTMKTEKTGAEVEGAYLTGLAVTVWEKYKDGPGPKAFPLPNRNDYNDQLRGLARQAGLDRIVDHVDLRNWKRKLSEKKLYQAITSHTARKTFCSIAYNRKKYTLDEIMLISGHKDPKTLQRYVKADDHKMRELAERGNVALIEDEI